MPLYKEGSKANSKKVRLIFLLPIMILKTIKKIIHDRTIEHLTDNQILYKYQSGCQNQSVKTNQQIHVFHI